MSVHHAAKEERKKWQQKKSVTALDDLWPDSKRPEFHSESPVVFSVGFGSDGCTLNFQTASQYGSQLGQMERAGMIQGTDGLCCTPPSF